MGATLQQVGRTLGLALLALLPAQAAAEQAHSFDQLSKVLKPGDVVEIVQRGQARTKGQVSEITGCSVVLLRDQRRVSIDASAVNEIKLLRKSGAAPSRTVDAGARCENAACMAMSLTLSGTTAIGRGFGKLFAKPRVVYRTPAHAVVAPPCSAQFAGRAR